MSDSDFPCSTCTKGVNDEDAIFCSACDHWVHLKCTDLTETQFNYHINNPEETYFCLKCTTPNSTSSSNSTRPSPSPLPTPQTRPCNPTLPSQNNNPETHNLSRSSHYSPNNSLSYHSSDFET